MKTETSLDIDLNVNLNVSHETAETCLRILNTFLKSHYDCKLYEKEIPVTEIPVGCSNVKVYQYEMSIPF